MKLIKQESGALVIDTSGKNRFVFNWNDGMMEIWHNKKKVFTIDMNKEN